MLLHYTVAVCSTPRAPLCNAVHMLQLGDGLNVCNVQGSPEQVLLNMLEADIERIGADIERTSPKRQQL